MTHNEIAELIKSALPEAEVSVEGDGSHFNATIISDVFDGLNTLKRQQLVYKSLKPHFLSGDLHALSMKTYTAKEWQGGH